MDAPFKIERKPQPEPTFFRCAICEKHKSTDRADGEHGSGLAVCASCADHWGTSPTVKGYIGWADRRTLRRLSSMATRLDWEVKNGQGRSRRYTNI